MTLTPPFCGQPGRSMPSATAAWKKIAADAEGRSLKCRRRDGQKIIGRTERRRWKRRKVAHRLAARRAGESCASTSRRSCRMLPCRRHKSSYMQCRLMRRCPLCGASGARVSAVSSLNRSTARFIEYNCVLCQSRRRRCHADCCPPSPGGTRPPAAWQSARQLAGHPSRPPLTWRKKFGA